MPNLLALIALMLFQPSGAAPDFAIRFDHKGCHYEYIDTFKGTYSHTGATTPVPFVLSDDHRQQLFGAIIAAKVFDLPSRTPGAGSGDPADNLELEVRNSGRHHTVAWSVGSEWLQAEAGRPLRQLHRAILDLLATHPDVKRLPARGDGCYGGPPKVR